MRCAAMRCPDAAAQFCTTTTEQIAGAAGRVVISTHDAWWVHMYVLVWILGGARGHGSSVSDSEAAGETTIDNYRQLSL